MNGSSDIIIKLFDTLKDATNKSESTMQTLITQQQTLVDTVKHMPMNEIRQDIKDHIISAQKERKEISNKIEKVDSKVVKMILVVIVAFTILTGSYMFVRSASDYDHIQLKTDIMNELNQTRSEKP